MIYDLRINYAIPVLLEWLSDDAGCWILDSGYWIPVAGYKIPYSGKIIRPTFQHSISPTSHYSNIPLFQHSITPTFHSKTPSLQYSITPGDPTAFANSVNLYSKR